MKPDLEVVQIGRAESFKAWEHGYPFRTVRWHFHPECEIHYVVSTSGRYFVGDFIGSFEPGNLVLTGPNLPHNWVSDTSPDEKVPLRSRVVQFTEGFMAEAMALMPELAAFRGTLERSRRGLLFGAATSAEVGPMLADLVNTQSIRRLAFFVGVIGSLSRASDVHELTSDRYLPDPSGFMSVGINKALAYINTNLTEPFSESDLAEIAGLSPSAFSRSFRRHTGLALVQYINRLRVNFACHLLMEDEKSRITDVCFASGFNNLSNFNRQFLKQKGMTPSRFRALLNENLGFGVEARASEEREEMVPS
jgi:AraC-like DNA-binding protein